MSIPYVSVAEFQAALTGLDQSPSQAQMDDLVRNASGWADEQCQQKLMATQDVEDLRLNSRRAVWRPNGTFHVSTAFSPIISIDKVELSLNGIEYSPLDWTAKAKTPASVLIAPGSPSSAVFSGYPPSNPWLRLTYTDGFPNAFLAAPASASDTAIVVDDPTGIRAGTLLTIFDPSGPTRKNEPVTVADSYSVGATTIPLTAGLVYAHAAGVRVSAMPPAIREAVIIAAQEEAKQAGRDLLVRDSTGVSKVLQRQTPSQLPRAEKNLERYARVL